MVEFGHADAPLVQVQVLTHVGELGQGQGQVLLHDHVEVNQFKFSNS